jgi:hypothetical protein
MRPRDSCRENFKRMKIRTLYSQCIYALLLFVINNKNLFKNNSELNEHKTRLCKNLHLPTLNLAEFGRGVYITGIKVFNHLPQSIKRLVNDEKVFKSTVKRILCYHSFYFMKEFYQYSEI